MRSYNFARNELRHIKNLFISGRAADARAVAAIGAWLPDLQAVLHSSDQVIDDILVIVMYSRERSGLPSGQSDPINHYYPSAQHRI